MERLRRSLRLKKYYQKMNNPVKRYQSLILKMKRPFFQKTVTPAQKKQSQKMIKMHQLQKKWRQMEQTLKLMNPLKSKSQQKKLTSRLDFIHLKVYFY